MEHADGVAAGAHAGHDAVGQPAFFGQDLLAGLVADHRLEVAHHGGIGRRPHHRADDVVGGLDVGHPVADGLVGRVLEGAAARCDRQHLGAEQPHAEHVELLAADVLFAHVDMALEAEERGHRGRGDSVLPGARLGDDALLAHAHREQDLAERVVDLVRAGVGQVLTLEVDAAAHAPQRAAGEEQRRRPAGIVGLQGAEFGEEVGVVAVASRRPLRAPRGPRPASRAHSGPRRGRIVVAVSSSLSFLGLCAASAWRARCRMDAFANNLTSLSGSLTPGDDFDPTRYVHSPRARLLQGRDHVVGREAAGHQQGAATGHGTRERPGESGAGAAEAPGDLRVEKHDVGPALTCGGTPDRSTA